MYDQALKLTFLCNLLLWTRMYIDGDSLTMIDFIYWLGSSWRGFCFCYPFFFVLPLDVLCAQPVLLCTFIRHRWNIYICLPKNNNNKCDCILLFVRDCTGKVRLQRKVNRQRRQAYEFKIIIKYNESDNTRPMSSQVQIEGCTRTRQGEHKTQEQQEKFWAFVPTKDTGTSSEADNPNKRKQIGHDKCLLLQLKMEFIFFFQWETTLL